MEILSNYHEWLISVLAEIHPSIAKVFIYEWVLKLKSIYFIDYVKNIVKIK